MLITKPINTKCTNCFEYFKNKSFKDLESGTVFTTLEEAANHYNMSKQAIQYFLKMGWNKKRRQKKSNRPILQYVETTKVCDKCTKSPNFKDLQGEICKPTRIPKIYGSSFGRLYRELDRGRKLIGIRRNPKWYLTATFNKKCYYIHRLIAEAFYYPKGIPKYLCVNHIDGVKYNNKISNLEVITYSENIKHYHKLRSSKKTIDTIEKSC